MGPISTNTPMATPTTIVAIYKFDGVKYVLQSQGIDSGGKGTQ